MDRFAKAAVIVCALALPAVAQTEYPPVPVEKAAYHWPVFKNDYVMVLRVIFPPGRGSNYHIHSTDQIGVVVETGANANQLYGEAEAPPRPATPGSVGFTAYSKKQMIHRSTNKGTTPFHNVVVSLSKPQAAGVTPGARPDPYKESFDNERARAWKLALDPGQQAPAITQKGPGMRVVITGGEITEIIDGQPDRGQALRLGDFYWQDPGATRAIKNTGSTRIEIAEFELK
jgi:quercetin dioxygenase-like cupin family protein